MEYNNQESALLLFKAMNERSFALVENHLDAEVVLEFPGVKAIMGKKRIIIFLGALLRKYPVLQFNVHEVVVDGDRVCAVWTNQGNNLAGEPYSNSGITLFHIEKGKILFISDYFKDTSFVK